MLFWVVNKVHVSPKSCSILPSAASSFLFSKWNFRHFSYSFKNQNVVYLLFYLDNFGQLGVQLIRERDID